ncbi:hypothetical protein JM946_11880 [Steroidobacter sp. S1-65]|uniref:Uncharacterized protein n=1 Tax=Steroidobacter gossypii TaxID=2805490 RepID=A0ABS1WWV2_9GAMM|nr:hypothetical protein [Steroidobacter gossypii]MBM0105454.1 hypothetical protein [Steroidobacter gossypii]
MKTAYLVSCSVLVVLMTTVVGAVGSDVATPSSTVQQSASADTDLLVQLNSAPTFSDSTLRRPF